MVFSSIVFIFVFLPVTLLGYYISQNIYIKNVWLLIVSLIFFGWNQPQYLWIIVANILINYCSGMALATVEKRKKAILVLTIILNLGILFYFKYFDFAVQTLNHVARTHFELFEIVLPVGISFFTFQGMSYVIDVYREDVSVQKNIFKLALYIILFPQLIAGPIVRYKDIETELTERNVSLEDFCEGIESFIVGLGKKVLIANTMAVTVDSIWQNLHGNTCIVAWLGSIAYTLQIFFDFSGYSDMAIGLGRMFGFHFCENFRLPYTSRNISEFWRRWHISLSAWFRDYVYIPLGGNHKKVYRNLAVVFLLTGLWHGASWNFVLWGIWHGMFILFERYLKNGKPSHAEGIAQEKKNSTIQEISSRLYTLMVVNFGWILFRAPRLKDAGRYILTMIGITGTEAPGFTLRWYMDNWTIVMMAVGLLASTHLPQCMGEMITKRVSEQAVSAFKYLVLLLVLSLSMIRIVSGTYNPFIYFQF